MKTKFQDHMETMAVLDEAGVLAALKLSDLLADMGGSGGRSECQIIPAYMPPFPDAKTKPILCVYHPKYESFLRYSIGPRQGVFWDAYGDDLMNVGLALRALLSADMPLGKPYVEFSLSLGSLVVPPEQS